MASTTLAESGNKYEAVFTNSAGAATSNAATLTVTQPTTIPPVVTTQPTNQTVAVGGTATFTAAASGTPAPTVQWQSEAPGASSFTPISGATSTTLTVPNVTAAQSGTKYEAVFTNSAGSATSNAATLTVTTQSNAPVVTQVFPSRGSAFSLVVIIGKNFSHVRGVNFGSQSTFFLRLSDTVIIALAPPQGHSKITVDVTVTTRNGTSATSSADQFTYTSGFPFFKF